MFGKICYVARLITLANWFACAPVCLSAIAQVLLTRLFVNEGSFTINYFVFLKIQFEFKNIL